MSLARYAVLSLVACLTIFSADAGAIASQPANVSISAALTAAAPPCCGGTIVGDD